MYKKWLVRFKERRRIQKEAAAEREQQDELLEMLREQAEFEAALAEAEAYEDYLAEAYGDYVTEAEANGDYVTEAGENAAPVYYDDPDLEYYEDLLYDTDRHDLPFATQHGPPPFYDQYPEYDFYPFNNHFAAPHRLRRSLQHPPDEGKDGGDTANDPDQHNVPGSKLPRLPASDDLPDEDEGEDHEALQRVLLNLTMHLDMSGCSTRLLCHLMGKPQHTRTEDEDTLLRLFVGNHSNAPPIVQCPQEFPRCGLQGEELNAIFTLTSGLLANVL